MNRMKELRLKHNLSQKECAEIFNVHQTAISQWETGRTEPDTKTIRVVADYYNVSIDYLLNRDTLTGGLDEAYIELARAAGERNLRLEIRDIDFILDIMLMLKRRDEGVHNT